MPRAEQTDATQEYHRGCRGLSPQLLRYLCDFAAKNTILAPFQSHFTRF